MLFQFDNRPAESPLVQNIWQTTSGSGGSFMSSAACNMEIVITRQQGKTSLTVRGPETKASPAPIPVDAEFLGITFKLGTFMPTLPNARLLNGGINLPEANSRAFWLNGSAWEFPDFENVDTFVNRLLRGGLIAHEPVVEAALQGRLSRRELSQRSIQRRFVQATGLSQRAVVQIERARQAMALLEGGTPILDVVDLAGYSDQPHLTRALKQYIGRTPAQISGGLEI